MADISLRKSFLPKGVGLGYIHLGKNDSGESHLKIFNDKNCGFDYSGEYFVMFSDERSEV